MLDADAYLGRRAWLPCPRYCEDGCINSAVNLPCDQHWRYLLANEGRLVFLQCPSCMHRWWHDTGTSAGKNPPDPFSTHRREAA
jgi:hypothetical protein